MTIETSLRHPNVSLEDTIAMKLQLLIIDAVYAKGSLRPEGTQIAREIVTDIKALIRQEMTPPEPEPSVLKEGDVIKHVYRTGMKDWGLQIIHEPTGISVLRDSSQGFKSLLQGTADGMRELEGRVRAELARTSGN